VAEVTEFHVEAVRLRSIKAHPNADTLSIATIHDNYPVIFKTGEYKLGDLVAYVPVDSIVPDTEEWAWLGSEPEHRRIKAKKLRGVFSMGIITHLPKPIVSLGPWYEGANVAAAMGITKYDPDVEPEIAPTVVRGPKRPRSFSVVGWLRFVWFYFFGPKPPAPIKPPNLKHTPGKYDIEPFRKYGKHWFEDGEIVVVSEKIHGQNASFVHDGKKLHVKSRLNWRQGPTDSFQRVAKKYNLEEKLSDYPGIVLFGETYGNNSDMPYGVRPEERAKTGDRFAAFDAFDSTTGRWLDFYEFRDLCEELKIPRVPVYACFVWGKSSFDAVSLFAEGESWLLGAAHLREGFVAKPARERTVNGQRVILKCAGEGYLTRKAA
jgi:hypothetical protein